MYMISQVENELMPDDTQWAWRDAGEHIFYHCRIPIVYAHEQLVFCACVSIYAIGTELLGKSLNYLHRF